jgi:protein-disulfide isomerase/uncharacterized membrane protein
MAGLVTRRERALENLLSQAFLLCMLSPATLDPAARRPRANITQRNIIPRVPNNSHAPAGAPSRRGWWSISVLLIAVGWVQSAYLLGRGFALLSSTKPRTFDLCSALFARSCDAVLSDERFWFLGVPVAGWGIVYFTMLGGLLLLGGFLKREFEAEALLAAWLANVGGFAVGVALTLSAWSEHESLCPLCLVVHTVSLFLLVALWRASGQSVSERVRLLRGTLGWFFNPQSVTSQPTRWKLVGFACIALMGALAYQWVYVESALRRPHERPALTREEAVAAYRETPRVDFPVVEDDPHLGPLTAPVRLVVFESFRCPACRRFSGTLSSLRQRFGDRLLVVYKHYPLSTECNDRVTRDMQPGSCAVARAAEAAHRQARFWAFHDALFANGGDASTQAIAEVARHVRLDATRFAADRNSSSTRQRVAEDIALGNRLKIPGTPSVFLDGRLIRSTSTEVLETLIRYELAQHATSSGRVTKTRPLRTSHGT